MACDPFRDAISNSMASGPVDYLLEIADDGYVITTETEVSEEERLLVCGACSTDKWVHVKGTTDRLGECMEQQCSCYRVRNPAARGGFLQAVFGRLCEVAKGRQEVSIASLGCGLLQFEFTLLEQLLAAGIPIVAVHLVDEKFATDAKRPEANRAALAQFAGWFCARGVDIYAHESVEKFGFRVRQAGGMMPLAVLQIDCSELTWVFEKEIKPMLEEVLTYGGLFCALSSREGPSQTDGSTTDAFGEMWRLVPETGRMRIVGRTRYRPGTSAGIELSEHEKLPAAVGH